MTWPLELVGSGILTSDWSRRRISSTALDCGPVVLLLILFDASLYKGRKGVIPPMPASKTRGRQSRVQDAVATADDKLMRHIRALGLGSVEAYRAWCRQRGFSDSVSKDWQD